MEEGIHRPGLAAHEYMEAECTTGQQRGNSPPRGCRAALLTRSPRRAARTRVPGLGTARRGYLPSVARPPVASAHMLVEMRRAGVAADTITHSAATSACATAHQWHGALRLVEMRRADVAADAITYSAAISAYEAAGVPALPLHSALAANQQELVVLQFVRCRSAPLMVGAAIRAMEPFGGDCRGLKVAGGPRRSFWSPASSQVTQS